MGLNRPKLTPTFPVGLFPLRHSASRRFGVFEPPRTHSILSCTPASPFVTVVRGGSVRSSRPRRTRTCPAGLLPPSGQWFGMQADREVSREFGEVRIHRTSSKHCEEGGTTVTNGEAGLQGMFECVRGGSTPPNLLEPL